jgi:hypothetical protein
MLQAYIGDAARNIDENATLMIRGTGSDGAPPAAGVPARPGALAGIYRATVGAWRRSPCHNH